jgi:MSHA pilin protein MshD
MIQPSRRRALTLVECLFCCLIVSLAMVAALRTLASSAGTLRLAGDRAAARALADSLMTEILSQAYKDPGALPLFGREANELLSSRANWNDVDDYDGYTDSPPSDKTGVPIPGIPSNWSRTVSVNWANPANPPQNVATESGLKRVTISVKRGSVELVTITSYKGDLP